MYTVIEGKATTDVTKYAVNGMDFVTTDHFFRSLRASLINVQGMGVTGGGKTFGVVAGGGWADLERKRHYSVPLYSTDDMKSQLGELETGAIPAAWPRTLCSLSCSRAMVKKGRYLTQSRVLSAFCAPKRPGHS
jgi:hypothetical protein